MEQDEFLSAIPGAGQLLDWFGYWPSFHDAEVISIELNRAGTSRLRLHTWEMTKEVDFRGYYVNTKHVIVNFLMEEITTLQLEGFNYQNVLFGLDLQMTDDGYEITLDDCYGVTGRIAARQIRIAIEPGAPGYLEPRFKR